MTVGRKVLIGIAILLASISSATSAFCDFVVISSQTNALKVGDKIPDAAIVEIGNEEQLRLMDINSGETRALVGPYKGSIENYSISCSATSQSGVGCLTKDRSKPIGATRGIKRIDR